MKKLIIIAFILLTRATGAFSSPVGWWYLHLDWNSNPDIFGDTIYGNTGDLIIPTAYFTSSGPTPNLPNDFYWRVNGIHVIPAYSGTTSGGTYTFAQPGVWTMAVTGDTTVTLGTFWFYWNGSLGIHDQNSGQNILQLFPNPSNGHFTLTASETLKSVQIINLLGETIYFSELNSTQTEIDLADKTKGIYFIRATTDKGTLADKKIIISN